MPPFPGVNQTFSGPFVPEPYDNSAFVTRLADLINRRADVAAQGALQRGASRAQMWQSAGQAVMQTLAQLAQQRELTKQRAVAAEQQTVENAFKNRQIAVQEAAERNAAARAEADEEWRRSQWEWQRDRAEKQDRNEAAQVVVSGMGPGDELSMAAFNDRIKGTPYAEGFSVRPAAPATEGYGVLLPEYSPNARPAQPEAMQYAGTFAQLDKLEDNEIRKRQLSVPPNQQRETLLVNGKPTIVNFDPRSGTYTDANTGASVQVSPLPVAPQGPQPSWQWVTRSGEDVYTNRVQPGDTPRETTRVKATEDEKKSAGWFGQMSDALDVINQVEPFLTKEELYQIQSLPQEGLIGLLNRNQLSENAKRYLRAFEQFTEARLRSVSGNAISTGEYAADRRTYAKQYGETEKLANDRRNGRNRALESLQKRAGSALDTPPNKGKSFWDQ